METTHLLGNQRERQDGTPHGDDELPPVGAVRDRMIVVGLVVGAMALVAACLVMLGIKTASFIYIVLDVITIILGVYLFCVTEVKSVHIEGEMMIILLFMFGTIISNILLSETRYVKGQTDWLITQIISAAESLFGGLCLQYFFMGELMIKRGGRGGSTWLVCNVLYFVSFMFIKNAGYVVADITDEFPFDHAQMPASVANLWIMCYLSFRIHCCQLFGETLMCRLKHVTVAPSSVIAPPPMPTVKVPTNRHPKWSILAVFVGGLLVALTVPSVQFDDMPAVQWIQSLFILLAVFVLFVFHSQTKYVTVPNSRGSYFRCVTLILLFFGSLIRNVVDIRMGPFGGKNASYNVSTLVMLTQLIAQFGFMILLTWRVYECRSLWSRLYRFGTVFLCLFNAIWAINDCLRGDPNENGNFVFVDHVLMAMTIDFRLESALFFYQLHTALDDDDAGSGFTTHHYKHAQDGHNINNNTSGVGNGSVGAHA